MPRAVVARSKPVAACSAAVTLAHHRMLGADVAAGVAAQVDAAAPGGRRRRGSRRACPSSCCAARSARRRPPPSPLRSARGRASARRTRARRRRARRLASMRATTAVCAGSPLCEAQATASSSSPRPSWSAAPLATSGSACSTLTAERGNTGRSMSPSDADHRAVGIDDGDRAAMRRFAVPPRIASTRIGVHRSRDVLGSSHWRRRRRPRGRIGAHAGDGPGLVLLAALLHAHLERGRQAHRRRRPLRLDCRRCSWSCVWAPLGIWAAWDAVPRWGWSNGRCCSPARSSTSSTSRRCCAATGSPTSPSSIRWRAAPGRCWRRSARCSGSANRLSAVAAAGVAGVVRRRLPDRRRAGPAGPRRTIRGSARACAPASAGARPPAR